jgi:hypothetical protein
MANLVNQNPLILTTAATSNKNMGLPGNQVLKVFKIIWYQPTSAGDTFTISNGDGSVILKRVAEAASGSVGNTISMDFGPPGLTLSSNLGWYLSQISSGTLYIYSS